jgi:hypothetical protein
MPSPKRVLLLVGCLLVAQWLLSPSRLAASPAVDPNSKRFLLNRDLVTAPAPPLWILLNKLLDPFSGQLFPLTTESILALARLKGCNEFWNETAYWLSGLEALTRAIRVDQPPLTPLGRGMLSDMLSNALCVQHKVSLLLKRHPEIEHEQIKRPIIIAGPPRTGSTFLLSLLSMHPNATAVRYAEAVEPVASAWLAGDDILGWMDWRIYKVGFATRLVKWLIPSFESLFGNLNVDSPFEEMQLGSVVFGSSLFSAQFLVPTYDEWFLREDQTPMERYTKLLLQVIQFQRGGTSSRSKTWVLKSPQNAELLYAKAKVYPDAIHVFTERDYLEVVKSLVPMLSLTSTVFCDGQRQNYSALARFWVKRQAFVIRNKMSQEAIDSLVRRDRQVFLPFAVFMRDPVEAALGVIDKAGLEGGEQVRQIFEAFVKAHGREGSAKFLYDLESFGVNIQQVQQVLNGESDW